MPKILDLYESATVRHEMTELMSKDNVDSLDFKDCNYIDSSGIAIVLWIYNKIPGLKILNVNVSIEKVFKVLNIPIYGETNDK